MAALKRWVLHEFEKRLAIIRAQLLPPNRVGMLNSRGLGRLDRQVEGWAGRLVSVWWTGAAASG